MRGVINVVRDLIFGINLFSNNTLDGPLKNKKDFGQFLAGMINIYLISSNKSLIL